MAYDLMRKRDANKKILFLGKHSKPRGKGGKFRSSDKIGLTKYICLWRKMSRASCLFSKLLRQREKDTAFTGPFVRTLYFSSPPKENIFLFFFFQKKKSSKERDILKT